MNLADRITRLEGLLRTTAGLPVVLEESDLYRDRPGPRTIVRSCDGTRWDQMEGEPLEDFKRRAISAAARGGRAVGTSTEIRIVMLRPTVSRDQWLAMYGSGRVAA